LDFPNNFLCINGAAPFFSFFLNTCRASKPFYTLLRRWNDFREAHTVAKGCNPFGMMSPPVMDLLLSCDHNKKE
jgi:hypothetical protein